MTYIEFFDKNLIENVCSALAKPPEKVILIGSDEVLLTKQAAIYTSILARRGFHTAFETRTVIRDDFAGVLALLCTLAEENDECVIDLTGGDDVFLVAAGIVAERYKDRHLQLHRFDLKNETVCDVDGDGKTILETELPVLSVEEAIRIYGGDVVYESVKPGTTTRWDLSQSLGKDVDAMWNVCRKNVKCWNRQINVFAAAAELADPEGEHLTISLPRQDLEKRLRSQGSRYYFSDGIVRGLKDAHLITAFEDGERFSVTFRDRQIRKCLTKAGQALEMKIYVSALRAKEEDGAFTYHDVMNGVYIDWDGVLHTDPDSRDTENEIDVLMMHGMIPVFVSCKNGMIAMEELYKLNTVALRFGGIYAKKVLVATALDENGNFARHFRERARDMGIRIIDRPQDKSESELQAVIRSFYQ